MKSIKPVLIIGLGNSLLGDEGVGFHAADILAADSRLPAEVEVLQGGTDLLKLGEALEGRRLVILVDAVMDPDHPGVIEIYDNDFSGLRDDQAGAHQLSVIQAFELLRLLSPTLSQTRVALVTINISEVQYGEQLTPETQTRLSEIVDIVLNLGLSR